jgi:hypothetical protein
LKRFGLLGLVVVTEAATAAVGAVETGIKIPTIAARKKPLSRLVSAYVWLRRFTDNRIPLSNGCQRRLKP